MQSDSSPNAVVRDAVARADQRRRTVGALREAATVAPVAAGLVLVNALVGRVAGWSPLVTVGLLVVLAAAIGIRIWMVGRARPVSDPIAAGIDADANLQGELRSAHWFASGETTTPWADFHVDQAATRVGSMSWDTLYPSVRATRAWAGAGGLCVLALAVSLWSSTPRPPSAAELAIADLAEMADSLPPELQIRLDALLEGMDDGIVTAEDLATLQELQDLIAELDPAVMESLAQLAEEREMAAEGTREEMSEEELSEMVENSAAGMPEDVRWALEDLAARLANANAERQTNPENPNATSETGETAMGSEQAASEEAGASEAGMQLMRQAASEAGDSQTMMAGAGAMGGDSSAGAGGNQGQGSGDPEEFVSIAEALRQELIEAADDSRGENVENEDIRRKTEQGTSALGYTRVAPATFNRSRAVAPPQVPDARRPLLFNYFIRQR